MMSTSLFVPRILWIFEIFSEDLLIIDIDAYLDILKLIAIALFSHILIDFHLQREFDTIPFNIN